jgi:hypothetical protein
MPLASQNVDYEQHEHVHLRQWLVGIFIKNAVYQAIAFFVFPC